MTYFFFKIIVTETRGGSRETPWMDERISNIITIDERYYLSCDNVYLYLMPISGDFEGSVENSANNLYLWREWAPINDNPLEEINWRQDTGAGGRPNDYRATSTGSRMFDWTDSWPENRWLVKYYFPDTEKRFRVKIRFRNGDDEKLYFVVPWAIELMI